MARYYHIVRIPWNCLAIAVLILTIASCAPVLHKNTNFGPKTYFRLMDYFSDNFQRSYHVHVPTNYDKQSPLPLVVVLHGAFDNGRGMEKFSGFSRLADRENFIVLYPNGIGILGYLQHWNAGHCCGKAAKDNINDVDFIAAAIEDVSRRLSIDRDRVYMVGFSNGGMMTYRFASEKGKMLAAAAPLAASIGGRLTSNADEWRIGIPEKPLPLIVMHGMDDNDILYEGGRSQHRKGERTYWSVDDSITFWLDANKCLRQPVIKMSAKGAVLIKTWNNCINSTVVTLYKISQWGHVWPGLYFTTGLPNSHPLKNFDAAEITWDFFKRFP